MDKAVFYGRVMESSPVKSSVKYKTYRVTIPKNVVEALNLKRGDLLEVTIRVIRRSEHG